MRENKCLCSTSPSIQKMLKTLGSIIDFQGVDEFVVYTEKLCAGNAPRKIACLHTINPLNGS